MSCYYTIVLSVVMLSVTNEPASYAECHDVWAATLTKKLLKSAPGNWPFRLRRVRRKREGRTPSGCRRRSLARRYESCSSSRYLGHSRYPGKILGHSCTRYKTVKHSRLNSGFVTFSHKLLRHFQSQVALSLSVTSCFVTFSHKWMFYFQSLVALSLSVTFIKLESIWLQWRDNYPNT